MSFGQPNYFTQGKGGLNVVCVCVSVCAHACHSRIYFQYLIKKKPKTDHVVFSVRLNSLGYKANSL